MIDFHVALHKAEGVPERLWGSYRKRIPSGGKEPHRREVVCVFIPAAGVRQHPTENPNDAQPKNERASGESRFPSVVPTKAAYHHNRTGRPPLPERTSTATGNGCHGQDGDEKREPDEFPFKQSKHGIMTCHKPPSTSSTI